MNELRIAFNKTEESFLKSQNPKNEILKGIVNPSKNPSSKTALLKEKTALKANLEKTIQTFESHDRLLVGVQPITSILQEMIDTKSKAEKPKHILECIFVCKADTNISLLYSHLPPMSALATLDSDPIPILPLAKGSCYKIAEILKIPMQASLIIGIKQNRFVLGEKKMSRIFLDEFDMLLSLVHSILPNPPNVPIVEGLKMEESFENSSSNLRSSGNRKRESNLNTGALNDCIASFKKRLLPMKFKSLKIEGPVKKKRA